MDLRELGQVHFGRRKDQPSRAELREFHQQAEELLQFTPSHFEEDARSIIAEAIGGVICREGYTCWQFATLWNHTHVVTRVHRHPGHLMWEKFADASRLALREAGLVPHDHPVWSARPYVVFKSTVRAVRAAVKYVGDNPEKEGLPRQHHPFVVPYDGWPYR